MCGIFFCLHPEINGDLGEGAVASREAIELLKTNLRAVNAERGPDSQSTITISLGHGLLDKASALTAEFYGAELHLRGEGAIQQPHLKDGNILCWNGEIFGGLEVLPNENDGTKLAEALSKVQGTDGVVDVFGGLEGPYAFVYYEAASRRLYFSRDPLGRRSLLVHKPTKEIPAFLVSSVSSGDPDLQFEEVSTDGIYCLDLSRLERALAESPCNLGEAIEESLGLLARNPPGFDPRYANLVRINDSIPPEDLQPVESLETPPAYLEGPINDFLDVLDRSTAVRVTGIPRVGVEGAKSARVSVLFSGGIDSTIVAFLAHKHTPLDEPIDLFNVGFENPRKIRGNVDALPRRQKKLEKASKGNASSHMKTSYRVPDRVTGLQELEELRRLCPGRTWTFVEVNVPYEETQSARKRVEMLMLPSRTVMDLSLALALYFAARGKGQIRSHPDAEPVPYTSPARVVLSGLGSDELLGGYGRHRTAYTTGGWQAVIEELQLEIDRIPTRNLGRDDRIISSHGKETRHPFLSLDVVSFLAKLPVHYKMDPRVETGMGDKMLLRLLVRKLGLVEASGRKKRAMQFGSHSARMDGEKKGDVPLAHQE